ncbi:DedA family protein [Embleya sp. MST-111070]|uniref:DedA family protein n=1 Tax=Embleya sp. MST-111070 TaxID=3398231 RepID=UPI003F734239
MDAVHEWVDRLGDLPPLYAYVVIALVAIIETGLLLGVFAPAEPVLLLGGLLTSTGHLALVPVLIIATSAALAGDTLGYLSGRHRSERIRTGRIGRRVGEHRWERAEEMFTRGRGAGGVTVMLGRWVAFARTLLPRLAGAAGMPYRRFAPWNAVGIVVWVPGSIMLGRLAGSAYPSAASVPGWIGAAIVAIGIVAGTVTLIRRRRRRSAEEDGSSAFADPTADAASGDARRDFAGATSATREDSVA